MSHEAGDVLYVSANAARWIAKADRSGGQVGTIVEHKQQAVHCREVASVIERETSGSVIESRRRKVN